MIHVLSRQGFKETELVGHVISIWGTCHYHDQDVMNPKLESMKSYLKLQFDDITKVAEKSHPERENQIQRFNIEHLEEIRHFATNVPLTDVLIVHCDAGLSRSAAVGEVLSSFLERKVAYERSAVYPNSFISRVMKRYWNKAN